MDAGTKSINDIFNGNRILQIPFFQRAYVWGDQQWKRLIDDMELITATNRPYFLGSVILKQQQTNTNNGAGDIRTVIDGQQRLTTLNIFFKVLCLKTNQSGRFDRTFRLFDNELALDHNHNDKESFSRVLSLTDLDDIGDSNNILKAYNYFKENVDATKVDLDTIITRLLFVAIDLHHEEDEQQIFDTINSLGVGLTTAELLKNYFFNRDVESYALYWKSIFEPEGDEDTRKYWDKKITMGRSQRTFIDLFFYSYLQIKIQEDVLNVNAKDKARFSNVETLFNSYKEFIGTYHLNVQNLLTEIREYAILFRDNFDYDIINQELPNEHGIERINAIIFGLDTSTLISYVLFVLKNVRDENQRNELFEAIESYVMRRMVVNATTKNYNQLFTDRLISHKILSKQQFDEFIEKQADKVNYMPTNDELKAAFHNYVLINKQSAGIIYFIESKIRNRSRHATQLLGLNKYSLEHLMPKKWENNWGKIEDVEERTKRNRKLLTLGNLAIITQSLNASIRDANWQTKKDGRAGKLGLHQYSGGIETLSPFLQIPEWNEKEIENRANFLYESALETWRSQLPVNSNPVQG